MSVVLRKRTPGGINEYVWNTPEDEVEVEEHLALELLRIRGEFSVVEHFPEPEEPSNPDYHDQLQTERSKSINKLFQSEDPSALPIDWDKEESTGHNIHQSLAVAAPASVRNSEPQE